MGQRGRKSTNALTVAPVVQFPEPIPRPDPPADLTDEQADEWRAVVDRLSADWFPRETHAMLAQYCRHVVAARRVAQLISVEESRGDKFDVFAYETLLRMQEREGRAITSLATKMRISQQSTVRAEKARKPSPAERPWQKG